MANIYHFVNPDADCDFCNAQYADIIVFADSEEIAIDLAKRLTEQGTFEQFPVNHWVAQTKPEVVGFSYNRNNFATGRWKEYCSFD